MLRFSTLIYGVMFRTLHVVIVFIGKHLFYKRKTKNKKTRYTANTQLT